MRFLAPADAKLALTQGSVDAWATWEPYTALAEVSGHARVLVSGRGLLPGLELPGGHRRGDRRQAAGAAGLPAARGARPSPGRTATSMPTRPRWPASSASRPRPPKLQFERRQQKWMPIDAQVIADQQGTADFYRQVGLIRQPLDVRGTFDTGFALAAG